MKTHVNVSVLLSLILASACSTENTSERSASQFSRSEDSSVSLRERPTSPNATSPVPSQGLAPIPATVMPTVTVIPTPQFPGLILPARFPNPVPTTRIFPPVFNISLPQLQTPTPTPLPSSEEELLADLVRAMNSQVRSGVPSATTVNIPAQDAALIKSLMNYSSSRAYTPWQNCTTFAQDFAAVCEDLGAPVRTVYYWMPGVVPHAVNLIQISTGQWCLVEPQRKNGKAEACFDDPNAIPTKSLCNLMGKPEDCGPELLMNLPGQIPHNAFPEYQALVTLATQVDRQKQQQTCVERCVFQADRYRSYGITDNGIIDEFQRQCVATCTSLFETDANGI